MYRFNQDFVVIVTDTNIEDILVTALEGGINYWCSETLLEESVDDLYKYFNDGGKLTLRTTDNEVVFLDKSALLEGIKLYSKQGCVSFLEVAGDHLELDTCSIDAEVADAIVQYAVFGDVIFG